MRCIAIERYGDADTYTCRTRSTGCIMVDVPGSIARGQWKMLPVAEQERRVLEFSRRCIAASSKPDAMRNGVPVYTYSSRSPEPRM